MSLFQTVSFIEWLIFSQIILALFITNVFTVFYNRRLKKYNRKLMATTETHQNSTTHSPSQTQSVTDSLPKSDTQSTEQQSEASTQTPQPSEMDSSTDEEVDDNGTDIIEVVGGELSDVISRSVEQTESRLSTFDIQTSDIKNADLPEAPPQEALSAIMRFQFLEGEKLLLPFANDPELLWNTLQPCYDKIIGIVLATCATHTNKASDIISRSAEDEALIDKLNRVTIAWQKIFPMIQDNHNDWVGFFSQHDLDNVEKAEDQFTELLNINSLINQGLTDNSTDNSTIAETITQNETDVNNINAASDDQSKPTESAVEQAPESIEPNPEVDEAMQALDKMFEENLEENQNSDFLTDNIDDTLMELDNVNAEAPRKSA